ncbi:MAG: NFACT RNA binding domain-containing protein [Cyanobacteria bacterium P01_D01_bin.105]
MQPVDFTTLAAVGADLRSHWLPARCEQVYQRDPYTIFIALRTLEARGWLAISWHPQAARLHIAPPPPKQPDTFTFSQQLKHQLGGLVLTKIEAIAPWERAIDLQFAHRPNEAALWHLYVEIMGKYSNVILATADNQIVTAAHQVSEQQSSVRPIQTGKPYVAPPAIRGKRPSRSEAFSDWRDRVALIPGPLKKMLVKSHSGVSSSVASQLIAAANLAADAQTTDLSVTDWQKLFHCWHGWLQTLETETFEPAWRDRELSSYTVLAKTCLTASSLPNALPTDRLKDTSANWLSHTIPVDSVQTLLNDYYRHQFNQEEFRRLYNRISQRLKTLLTKLRQKARTFSKRLKQSDEAESYRQEADLLMAHLHQWQVGMNKITLTDFESGQPVTLSLNPEKNAVQNAQIRYKQHQKLKRARLAVMPLLTDVQTEINYLEQVEESLMQMPTYQEEADLRSLEETGRELINQGYLRDQTGYQAGTGNTSPGRRQKKEPKEQTGYRQYKTLQGFTILIGRNNTQNEQLTFKQASDYDLWFHAQEIPGSHVLLRLNAGDAPSDETMQTAANIAAYYSRARQSDQVPVVYTQPQHVYKPKGALPGMVIYKKETIIWAQPIEAKKLISH